MATKTRVSFEAALEVLASRPELYMLTRHQELKDACRCIKGVIINGTKYLMICGQPANHPGTHEDVAGGVYW